MGLFRSTCCTIEHNCVDGYINENGVINVKRLQVVLDEMAQWEQEVFEKEYSDLNWFKGKQAKHLKEMEMGRKRSKLGTSLNHVIRCLGPTPLPIDMCFS